MVISDKIRKNALASLILKFLVTTIVSKKPTKTEMPLIKPDIKYVKRFLR
jgi:hypothetical protein